MALTAIVVVHTASAWSSSNEPCVLNMWSYGYTGCWILRCRHYVGLGNAQCAILCMHPEISTRVYTPRLFESRHLCWCALLSIILSKATKHVIYRLYVNAIHGLSQIHIRWLLVIPITNLLLCILACFLLSHSQIPRSTAPVLV